MKRVVDSGLWVPGAGGSTRVEDEEFDDDEEEEEAAGQAVGEVTGEASVTKVPASPPSPTGVGSSEEA